MSHELNMQNGKASMAYVGDTPWHGLGQKLTEAATIDDWKREAGMSYTIKPAQMTATAEGLSSPIHVPNKVALYRDDTEEVLGVVGSRYKVVQPEEVLEFFQDLVEERGFVLDTAGVLFNGSKYWAMARTPHELRMDNDMVKEHLLLATACDGSLATTARYVRTRVVCNNTIQAAMGEDRGRSPIIRVEHRSTFDATAVKKELQLLDESWKEFTDTAQRLADRRVSYEEAARYFIDVYGDLELPMAEQSSKIPEETYMNFITNNYLGSDLIAAQGTAWGLLNVVTERVDWHTGKVQDRRLKSAWLGKGAELKMTAYLKAKKLL